MNSTSFRLPVSILALVAAASFAPAQTTTVSLTCDRDNTLFEDPAGALSNGAGSNVFVGTTAMGDIRRALLYFDVAGNLPAGAVILSATLEINVAQSIAFLPTDTTAHRVQQDWGEGASNSNGMGGGGGGAASATDDATWVHAKFASVLWNNVGGDFDPTPSFTIPLPGLGQFKSAPLSGIAADVQFWLDNPASNFGWLLKMDETLPALARRILSREGAFPPTLEVTYLLPGQGGTFGVGCPVGAGTYEAEFVGAPIGGTAIQISHTNAPPLSAGANFLSLGLDSLGTPLLPGCTVYLPLTQPFFPGDAFLTSAAGAGSTPFGVPAGFAGFLINCQGAVLDNSPLGFSLSNAALIVLQ